jgi:hypothetical protein
MAAAGHYKGDIDGDIGPKSLQAMKAIRGLSGVSWASWNEQRQLIGAAQFCLNKLGHEAGKIDGFFGDNTREALTAWQTTVFTGSAPVVERVPGPDYTPTHGQTEYPRQNAVESYYGPAGAAACTAGLVVLPIPFPLAWHTSELVRSFRCHSRVEKPMTAIFVDAVRHYGEIEYRKLRLDMFGGCYNFRKMRGGTKLSMHAYGIAGDLDPDRNQLRWGRDRATFAQAAYEPFWKIVEAQGAVSLGRAANMDWMHFQFARL